MKLAVHVGLGPRHIVFDGDPAPTPQRGTAPQFSAHVYCGQTVGHLSYCWALVRRVRVCVCVCDVSEDISSRRRARSSTREASCTRRCSATTNCCRCGAEKLSEKSRRSFDWTHCHDRRDPTMCHVSSCVHVSFAVLLETFYPRVMLSPRNPVVVCIYSNSRTVAHQVFARFNVLDDAANVEILLEFLHFCIISLKVVIHSEAQCQQASQLFTAHNYLELRNMYLYLISSL